MLSLPVNYKVEEINDGCCGMAGAFGYEKEHYDLSMKIGEMVLFPAVRTASAETVITAPGTSCRHHIADGTEERHSTRWRYCMMLLLNEKVNRIMMNTAGFSKVEQAFFSRSGRTTMTSKMPYIVVDNFPGLGLMTALRFLEWVAENPDGVISLPTGKTPEYFIKWTKYLLNNWTEPEAIRIREENGLFLKNKPSLRGLHFVQIDEFYPINPRQHNSFFDYVSKFYIEGFDLDPARALLINSEEITLAEGKHYSEVFPDNIIDLTLRNREAVSRLRGSAASLFSIDNWCTNYEKKVRALGGIGFFLGGIGPDGHIAFNTRGSDHNSATRLTATNFETQAASAGDLGGIEVSRTRLVITIGLGTITFNPDAVAIIFAAGDAKAQVVRNALESGPDNLYPATVLQGLKNARFYLTEGAAVQLQDSVERYFREANGPSRKLKERSSTCVRR
jgi:glucosamine-6-phosphate deaminase